MWWRVGSARMAMSLSSQSGNPDPGPSRSSPDKRTRVLFINSAFLAGADTWIHLLLLRNLSQSQFELHAAGQPGSPAPAFDQLRAIPGIALRPTNFGPSLWERSKLQKLAGIAGGLPAAAASMLALAAYI